MKEFLAPKTYYTYSRGDNNLAFVCYHSCIIICRAFKRSSGTRNKRPTIITAITKFNRLIQCSIRLAILRLGFSEFSTRTASKFDSNPGHSRNAARRFSKGSPRSVARRNMHEGDHRDGDPCSLSLSLSRGRMSARASASAPVLSRREGHRISFLAKESV